jgi:hypothetical protein
MRVSDEERRRVRLCPWIFRIEIFICHNRFTNSGSDAIQAKGVSFRIRPVFIIED